MLVTSFTVAGVLFNSFLFSNNLIILLVVNATASPKSAQVGEKKRKKVLYDRNAFWTVVTNKTVMPEIARCKKTLLF